MLLHNQDIGTSRRRTTTQHNGEEDGIAQKSGPSDAALPKIVSLFSGAGGLDLGFRQQGFIIPLAIDFTAAAIKTHQRNFQETHGVIADLVKLGPIGVLARVTSRIPRGERIGIIGGPPCQGFSRGNQNSRTDDPRNELPSLYIQIVRYLRQHYSVDFVVFENVLGMKDKKHLPTFHALLKDLKGLQFDVTENELCSLDFGVPQNRRRLILTAMRSDLACELPAPKKRKGPATVSDAIAGLPDPVFFTRGLTASEFPVHPNHWTMKPKSSRFTNPATTVGGRSFRRLAWDRPSPTIAFGHREIHVHPDGQRRLSIYEAMVLQGFPKSFVLEGNLSEQVSQISNAVPPPMANSIAEAVKVALKKAN
ncbi:MAG: DNA cytosine methyltransferase [Ignavibacteriae bacterium]|nr:DNA cytosine methyltransferase [Ignavibacteriota bacterium]